MATREPARRVLCVRHRAEEERRHPRFWCWDEAPEGLACERPECDKPADAEGMSRHTPETIAKMRATKLGKKRGLYQKRKSREAA